MAMMENPEFSAEEAEIDAEGLTLAEIVAADNVFDLLDEAERGKIGSHAKEQFDIDESSREDWLKTHDDALDLALQVAKTKSYPFSNASNVIYPLITTASIQFAARAYPAIVPSREIVKCKVIGDDSGVFQVDPQNPEAEPVPVVEPGLKAKRALRVGKFMSWQLLEQMESWEADTDLLMHYLPIAGCAFRKTWWEEEDGRPDSKFVSARDLVVNNKCASLAKAPQVSEIFSLWPHEVKERVLDGRWSKDGVDAFLTDDAREEMEFVEAHTRFDLDGDGYPEPYIVTFRKDGGEAVRVVANFKDSDIERRGDQVIRIRPRAYYTKYGFIPNPDGGFYDIGFGWLLGPINRSVNTAINQLIDAGNWQNAPSGFIGKRLRLRAGETNFKPNEWKQVDSFGETIRNEIVPLEFGGPSPVMFQLLGMMIDAGRDISSVKDIMLGDLDSNVAPTTALTMVEQGTKQFTAIYKRIHRALKKEMALLFRLDGEHIGDLQGRYLAILDDDDASGEDFRQDMDIMPVTDPDMVSEASAMARAQFLMTLASQGMLDPKKVTVRVLRAANIEEPDDLIPDAPPPDPEILIKMAKIENDKARIAMAAQKGHAEIIELRSKAIKNLADAEAAEAGIQMEAYKAEIEAMERLMNELAAISGMAAVPANAGGVQAPSGVRGGGGTGPQGAAVSSGPGGS